MKTAKQIWLIVLTCMTVIGISSCHQNGNYHENVVLESPIQDMMLKANVDELMEVSMEDVEWNTEEYDHIVENDFTDAKSNPLSTFSIDVDKASYANVRRFIENGQLPPKNAVRIEEMINYFPYKYAEPKENELFSTHTEIAQNPWNEKNLLFKIGIQGKKLDYDDIVPANLVFLIDVSGSMDEPQKLPLLKKSFKLMVNELPANSSVAIVTYAGQSGVVLQPTSVDNKEEILNALDRLQAGGSTAGAQGIELAYKLAEENLIRNGNNRVVLATDGDFNVGVSSTGELVDLISEKRQKDIFLTICGFGMGNYKDGRMKQISNAGNGNYFYIDSFKESQKVFQKELIANMFTIAKDVKIQVEFNPNTVAAYRLIGYENRLLNDQDFNDDTKDAGELGAGHTVTAFYEIVPKDAVHPVPATDPLRYQKAESGDNFDDLATVKLRFKPIESTESKRIEKRVGVSDVTSFNQASGEFKFAAAVSSYGMILRESKFKGTTDLNQIEKWTDESGQTDEYRYDFKQLVQLTKPLME